MNMDKQLDKNLKKFDNGDSNNHKLLVNNIIDKGKNQTECLHQEDKTLSERMKATEIMALRTSSIHRLPDAIIIGVQKCGTGI